MAASCTARPNPALLDSVPPQPARLAQACALPAGPPTRRSSGCLPAGSMQRLPGALQPCPGAEPAAAAGLSLGLQGVGTQVEKGLLG